MAIDTRNKRASAASVFPRMLLPAPSGAVNAGDRRHVVWSYRGFAAAVSIAVGQGQEVDSTSAVSATTPLVVSVAQAQEVDAARDTYRIVDGWSYAEPSPDTRIVYVSTSGSDSNDGLSELTPKQTISAGKGLLRNGFPDWLLLKRGDVWTDETIGSMSDYSGRGPHEPMRISAYGDENDPRPILEEDGAVVTCGRDDGSSTDYVEISSLDLYAYSWDYNSPRFNPAASHNNGIIWRQQGQSILVEDVLCRFHRSGISFDSRGPDGIRNLRLRRNVVIDSWSISSHSSGSFNWGVDGLLYQENIYDHNGYRQRGTGSQSAGDATIFNHNIYMSVANHNAILRNNLFLRASSHGTQVGSGGLCIDNTYLYNPISILLGRDLEDDQPHEFVHCGNNVIVGSDDINSNEQRGNAMTLSPHRRASIENNLASLNQTSDTNSWGLTIQTRPVGQPDYDLPNILNSLQDNIWFDWYRGYARISGGGPYQIDVVANNGYSQITASNLTPAPTDYDAEAVDWVDPFRDPATYHAALGRTPTLEAFVAELRQQRRGYWRTEYESQAFNAYVRAGFQVGVLTVSPGTERDTAYPVTPSLVGTVGQATEIDTAYDATPDLSLAYDVLRAGETDRAYSVSSTNVIGQAQERNFARSMGSVIYPGRATETDTAYDVTPVQPLVVAIVQAQEIDFAHGIGIQSFVQQSLEVDAAYPVTARLAAINIACGRIASVERLDGGIVGGF